MSGAKDMSRALSIHVIRRKARIPNLCCLGNGAYRRRLRRNLPRLALIPMHAIVNVIRAHPLSPPRSAMTGGRSLFSLEPIAVHLFPTPVKICAASWFSGTQRLQSTPLPLPPKVPPLLVLQHAERLSPTTPLLPLTGAM